MTYFVTSTTICLTRKVLYASHTVNDVSAPSASARICKLLIPFLNRVLDKDLRRNIP